MSRLISLATVLCLLGSLTATPSVSSQPAATQAAVEVAIARGEVALHCGNLALAREAFSEALDSRPDSVEARRGLGLVNLADGKPQEAIRLLEPALLAHPKDVETVMALARARIASGEPTRALALLDEAARLEPGRPEIPYYRGLASLRADRPAKALEELRQVAPTAGKVRQAASLYEGVALARLGRSDEARARFSSVMEAATSPALAELAGKFQGQMGLAARRQAKRTRGLAKLSLQYDDNVVVAPTNNVFSLRDQQMSSTGTTLSAGVFHDLVSTPETSLTAGYSFLQTLNFQANEVDIQDHGVSLTALRSGQVGGRNVQLGLSAGYDNLQVDQAAFLQRFTVSPQCTFIHDSRSATTLRLSGQRKDFLNEPGFVNSTPEDRDASTVLAGISHGRLLGPSNWLGSLGIQRDVESAVGANLDYRGVRYLASLSGRFRDSRFGFALQCALHDRKYDNAHSVFLVRRNDDEGSYFAAVSYELQKDQTLSLEYVKDRNVSNIALYDYDRNTCSIASAWRF